MPAPRIDPMQLNELLRAVDLGSHISGEGAVEISSLAYDSRRVEPGALFFCVPGVGETDGHEFAPDAVEAGAVALVVERELELPVAQAVVGDSRAMMAPIASRFFGDPTAEMVVVGITGTNGKTTTSFLVRSLLESAGRSCGLLGTVKQVVGGRESEAERTTPEAVDLQRTFREMLDAGDDACVMEVSSHALALKRVASIHFDAKVFTNLTQDHLDFHPGMEEYFEAKRLLFAVEGGVPEMELEGGISVVNADDPYGRRLAEEIGSGPALVTFSAQGGPATLSARGVTYDATGSEFACLGSDGVEFEVRTPLPARFNVENALAALGVGVALELDLTAAAAALEDAEQVPGRFESIHAGQSFGAIVDYAHTPDSLENVLTAARELTQGRLVTVFGCGGDRDRDKRPLMGRTGAELSDLAIITSDNPRSEDPAGIIEQVRVGAEGVEGAEIVVIEDRREAISRSLEGLTAGDTVVIAGKGHEQGQEFEQGRKIPFDDREVLRDEIEARVGQEGG